MKSGCTHEHLPFNDQSLMMEWKLSVKLVVTPTLNFLYCIQCEGWNHNITLFSKTQPKCIVSTIANLCVPPQGGIRMGWGLPFQLKVEGKL